MEKNPTAIKLRGKIERVFSYAIFKGEYLHPNPATYRGNLDMVFAPQSKAHTEKHLTSMTLDETREVCTEFWKRGSISHMAILFGVLTALRANEFIHARWDEIELIEALVESGELRLANLPTREEIDWFETEFYNKQRTTEGASPPTRVKRPKEIKRSSQAFS